MAHKLNWERINQARRAKKENYESLLQRKMKYKKYAIPDELNALFNVAEKKTAGSNHYRVIWSMRKQFVLRGYLSTKQEQYLKALAK